MANNPSNKVKTESIDEVILRLLGLKPGVEVDYQTYFEILKKKLAMARMGGKELPQEEDDLLRSELKRVKVIKDKGIRFKIKTKKTKISSEPSIDPSQKKIGSGGSEIVKYKKSTIVPRDISPVKVEDITEEKEKKKDKFSEIKKTLNSILNILTSKFKFQQKQSDVDRREKETSRRGRKESTLEGFKKGISTIVGLTKKVLSPFSDIIERIKRFIFFTLLGVAFNKFMNWLDDKENRRKFKNITDFLIDHWPAIVGLYILFGTSFGKLVRGLVKGIVRTVIALTMNIPRILSFIKKNKKLSLLGIGVASLASGYVSREVGNIFSSDKTSDEGLQPSSNSDLEQAKRTSEQAKETKVPTFNFGGIIPKMPSFNFGGMIPSIPEIPTFSMGGMDFQSGIPISGAGPDDTLIAAKTGEAILTEKDQVDLSKRYVDKKTGQPLNVPQYLSGRKPGYVNMSNLRFNGGRYFGGGTIPKFNTGGMIGNATNLIKKDEALSSITAGKNDYIKPKGRSVLSGIDWNSLTSKTPIHSYVDSVGVPTIGWGSTYYDGILNGTKKVKIGDIISKKQADTLLNTNVQKLAQEYSRSIPTWSRMTPNQRSGLLSMGYNAPAAPIGAYPKLTQALRIGDWATAAREMQRSGPNPERVRTEQRLMLDTSVPERQPITNKPEKSLRQPTIVDTIRNLAGSAGSNIMRMFGIPRVQNKQSGGIVGNQFSNSMINFKNILSNSGIVKEDTGLNIPGSNADRQLTALQPGEYVLPVDTVNRLGVSFIEEIVRRTDSNSEAFLAKGNIRRPQITPYNTMGSGGMGGVITLPPITQSSSGNRARASGYGGGSQVPNFSVTCPNNDRALNASIYGLIESTV